MHSKPPLREPECASQPEPHPPDKADYGFPHLCHRNPRVYEAMFEYSRMAIEELDFDGLRFDFVKGFGAWMIGLLAKYQYQKKNGDEFTPFVVGEYWSGSEDIGDWLDGVLTVTDQQIAAFDFPLRYKLKEVCDTPNYDLRKLTDGASVSAGRPFNAVTFTENHDMGGDEVVKRQNARLFVHSDWRRVSLYFLVGLLQLRACPARYAEWNRRADRRTSPLCGWRVHYAC
jgi:hypothetical protein